eukprot:8143748-Alexandrium_andersonii.AAC.1
MFTLGLECPDAFKVRKGRLSKRAAGVHAATHSIYCIALPRWNFANEDVMGKVKKIANKCDRRTVAARVMQRHLIKVRLKWSKRR